MARTGLSLSYGRNSVQRDTAEHVIRAVQQLSSRPRPTAGRGSRRATP
ncbi:hypothetical protein ACWEN3_21070 [Streptomyces sp. NPDC004561]